MIRENNPVFVGYAIVDEHMYVCIHVYMALQS
jgi:hypothetical protein